MATQTQFDAFLRDIEPSSTTIGLSSSAQQNLRACLRQHPKFKTVHLFTFLTGSYKRDTAIRPKLTNGKLEKPDIDIIVVTNYTLKDLPGDVLRFVRSTLSEEYELDREPHTRSVGVKTTTVDIDVVPIIAPPAYWGSTYNPDFDLKDLAGWTLYIPDMAAQAWQETNPPRQLQWATEINKASGGMFKPLVKLVKWWRRENLTSVKRPKGFTIECIVAACMDRNERSWETSFVKTLDGIINQYAYWYGSNQVPFISDPGVPANSVTSQLLFEDFAAFYKKIKEHAALAHLAQAETDQDKQLQLWRTIFGTRFPSAGTAAKSLLETAYVPTGLTFPDKPVAPRKPGGFA